MSSRTVPSRMLLPQRKAVGEREGGGLLALIFGFRKEVLHRLTPHLSVREGSGH